MALKIGIDVGGTNTDAAVLDGRTVVAATKSPTTEDVTSGILEALKVVLEGVDRSEIDAVLIGTTHFINAIAQAKGLSEVAVIRLATPPQSLLPMIDWPDRLRTVIGDHVYVCPGGAQFDGRLLSPLDADELRRIAGRIREAGIDRVAVSSVFSPVNQDPELEAEAILREELPGASITRSTEVGRMGLLERENATILNAALQTLAGTVVDGLERVLAEVGVDAPILLSQNDGTVMDLDRARKYPIFTIASGPTNSMRGAALLTGVSDAIVVDVGGTTTDIGMLQSGFPRESTVAMDLAGVRSNFRIPDVLSLAIGGGSKVSEDGATVGPESVGFRVAQDAVVFGGDIVTLTDVAVASGAPGVGEIGDAGKLKDLDDAVVRRALKDVEDRVSQAIERAKVTAEEIPVIVVGGGGCLLAAAGGLGAIIPENAGVANAVGAAFAEAGGDVDRVYALDGITREDALHMAKELAISQAVEAGADPDGVRIVDAEDIPLTHLPGGGAVRVRVKAVGPFKSLSAQALATSSEGH